jgi:hypothetical protein
MTPQATLAPRTSQRLVTDTYVGKDRSPATVLGLSIITLGIYYIVWYYKINNEIRHHDPDIKVSPGWAAAAISVGAILFFIPPLVSSYTTAARIRQMQLDDGATQTISPVVALLLHIFLGIGYPLYTASQLREHWHGHRRELRTALTRVDPNAISPEDMTWEELGYVADNGDGEASEAAIEELITAAEEANLDINEYKTWTALGIELDGIELDKS